MTYTKPCESTGSSPDTSILLNPLPPLHSLSSCRYFVFYDPAPCASQSSPGWPLRNLICLL
jgi:hypothetical protein